MGNELLFVVTEDWYFVSHHLPLAVAAQAAGFNLEVARDGGVVRPACAWP